MDHWVGISDTHKRRVFILGMYEISINPELLM